MMQKALAQADAPGTLLDVKGLTPSGAIKRLRSTLTESPEGRQKWNQKVDTAECACHVCMSCFALQARVAAVLGSCPRSRACFKSGRSVVVPSM